ncbi:MAG: hypothetical protein WBF34_32020 [Streptosporangiaceae bacterium]
MTWEPSGRRSASAPIAAAGSTRRPGGRPRVPRGELTSSPDGAAVSADYVAKMEERDREQAERQAAGPRASAGDVMAGQAA